MLTLDTVSWDPALLLLGAPVRGLRLLWLVRKEVGEFLQEVVVVLEQKRNLLVHGGDGLSALAVRVKNLEEGLVNPLILGKSLLDFVDVIDGLVEFDGLFFYILHPDLVALRKECIEAQDEIRVASKQNLHVERGENIIRKRRSAKRAGFRQRARRPKHAKLWLSRGQYAS